MTAPRQIIWANQKHFGDMSDNIADSMTILDTDDDEQITFAQFNELYAATGLKCEKKYTTWDFGWGEEGRGEFDRSYFDEAVQQALQGTLEHVFPERHRTRERAVFAVDEPEPSVQASQVRAATRHPPPHTRPNSARIRHRPYTLHTLPLRRGTTSGGLLRPRRRVKRETLNFFGSPQKTRLIAFATS